MKHAELVGRTFGRLTVQSVLHVGPRYFLECKCACGNITSPERGNVVSGGTTSCGCLKDELCAIRIRAIGLRHGEGAWHNKSAEYKIYWGILSRCYNPKVPAYPHYGGRGIIMCDRWRNSFLDFVADVGRRPSLKHSLDRYPDNDGNYEPGNVRWATMKEQCRNKRTNRWLTFNGKTQTISDWADELGLSRPTLSDRLERGWSLEDAMSTPPTQGPNKPPNWKSTLYSKRVQTSDKTLGESSQIPQ